MADHDSIEEAPSQLAPKDPTDQRFQPRSDKGKKKPLRPQVSKPPPNAVKIKPETIDVHFVWALVMTILCFFIIAPCWALARTFRLRRLIERGELEDAKRLSNRISTALMYSTIIGIFAWVAILFCSAGLMLTGALRKSNVI